MTVKAPGFRDFFHGKAYGFEFAFSLMTPVVDLVPLTG